jgi:hypothetical protein
MDTYKQETLYSQYRKALLYIADNYHLRIGQWKLDSEFGSKLYWFGK